MEEEASPTIPKGTVIIHIGDQALDFFHEASASDILSWANMTTIGPIPDEYNIKSLESINIRFQFLQYINQKTPIKLGVYQTYYI